MAFIGAAGTGGFKTRACEPGRTLNFLSSGKYDVDSYSCDWTTSPSSPSFSPDIEGFQKEIYLAVLIQYNISFSSGDQGLPPSGFAPGMDIKNMDAVQAIKLSLVENLLNGEWWELYEDNDGGVFFSKVFDNGAPGKIIDLDVRLCVPSSSLDNVVEMVIVRGYDPPPCRRIITDGNRDVVPRGTGLLNPGLVALVNLQNSRGGVATIDEAEIFSDLPCHSGILKRSVVKSYEDPVKNTAFNPQETDPFYDLKAFESLVGYVHKVEGMPKEAEDAARVSYSFSETTTLFLPIDNFPTFVRVETSEFCPPDIEQVFVGGQLRQVGLPTGGGIVYYAGTFTVKTPQFLDKFGTRWPFFIKPTAILYTGHEIEALVDQSGIPDPNATDVIIYVKPSKQLLNLSEGSQWIYKVIDADEFEITIYYQPKVIPEFWDLILDIADTPGSRRIVFSDGLPFQASKLANNNYTLGSESNRLIAGNSQLGFLINNIALAVEVNRPSVQITDTKGEARQFADSLRIQYFPIVITDLPAPIAYKHKDFGLVKLGNEKNGPQAVGLQDTDPTTCQDFDDTPLQLLQDRQQGNVQDVSLPFCKDADECAKVADTLFNYMSHKDTDTFVLTCGPNDEPELGAAVNGFQVDALRIESISYSYQDASSYTIDVTLGPVFTNVGSFNNGAWIRKADTAARRAIIRWSAGDGVNYRVLVQGLGEYNAINGTDQIWRAGEIVDVDVRNLPQETL